jgi:hypothetical protein
MKVFTIFFAFMLSAAVFAQSARVVERAPKNYENALKSDNPGLVESAIFHVVKFKFFYPEEDIQQLETQIDLLVNDGDTKTIRYKAYLASEFLKNGELLANIEKEDYKDGDSFFKKLADELENSMLVTR